ncbi:MAG: FeoA domain-containing protein [Acidobacteria bacterium]|nr:FeoA domain-containing protein [Acidobacteriota bacterium]
MTSQAWVLLVLIFAIAVAWPKIGLWTQWRHYQAEKTRRLVEDALKHIVAWEQRGQAATPESLAGALSLSQRRTLSLIIRMEKRGLLRSDPAGFSLTSKGESWALHVVRAHRLWERYLADDAGMPMERLHQAAEIAEHQLSAEKLDKLDAHLGHPQRDPHGDPIPAADGSLKPVDAVSLSQWPTGEQARIVHIEDEPDVIFRQIIAAGLRPGVNIRILENTPERLVISDGNTEHRLAHIVAANIQVAEARHSLRPAGAIRLSELPKGEPAEVIELDAACRGFSRRRLLDLGLTPQTRIEVALDNPFGDPRAYRVRGTTIALRRQQAGQIWVKPPSTSANQQTAKEAIHA